MDEDGFVYIEDRIKDMIISGGENVYPAEIEKVLQMHPKISEAAVIGQPSERWGESSSPSSCAATSRSPKREVLEFCNGRMARFKQPAAATFVDEVPRNPSGKILKRILREQFPGRRRYSSAPATRQPAQESTMELAELERRLGPFCEAMYETDAVRVFDVHKMPGHAGFSYGFSVAVDGRNEGWFIRIRRPT